MSEPTSVLDFEDLILEVAFKLGTAYYGASGTSAPAIPIDAHDLFVCKRIVNKAVRMFIHDAPEPNGWRWLRPTAELVIWGSVAASSANPILTAVHAAGFTTITVTSAAFYPSMELKDLVIPTVGTFNISSYTSSTVVVVTGDASAAHAASKTFSITADGNYTLPLGFGGQIAGQPTFAAGSDRGTRLEWSGEARIRQLRENSDSNTGTPNLMAVRVMTVGSPRRRWEAMFYPLPAETLTVQFPYVYHFDELVALTDMQPAPFGHDETIKAACLAVAEKDVTDTVGGPDWQYYRDVCLPNSYRVDKLSAPKKLGYFGSGNSSGPGIRSFRDSIYQRPNVSFNP